MTRARLHAILGWVPLGLSLAAFLIVVATLSIGWERGLKDEGAAAHLWQLFVAVQIPCILAFLATSGAGGRDAALRRLGLMTAALLVAIAPVAIFRL